MKKGLMIAIGAGALLYFLSRTGKVTSTDSPQTLQAVQAKEIISQMETNTLANVQAEMQRQITKEDYQQEVNRILDKGLSARATEAHIAQIPRPTVITEAMRKAGIDPRITTGKIDYSRAIYTPSAKVAASRERTRDVSAYPISARYG